MQQTQCISLGPGIVLSPANAKEIGATKSSISVVKANVKANDSTAAAA